MRKYDLLGKALAALMGLGLLVVVELALQASGAGPANELFVPARQNGEAVYALNPAAAHRFFQPQFIRRASTEVRFPRNKPPGSVRVFVLGASTLLGFPNPPQTAFPNFLRLMLQDLSPHRRFEVVNCGITAINSFCLLDFAGEIVDYSPDLVVLYAGHNEFIGPYGVTTPFLRFGNDRDLIRAYMFLQRSRLYYFLKEAMHRAGAWLVPDAGDPQFGPHLVSREIGLLDPGYQVTAENFRANMEELVRIASSRGTPVLLSTLVSNLRDFYPLRSDCDPGDLAGGPQAAEQAIARRRSALQRHPYCAGLHFELGRLYYERGDYADALVEFSSARDLDRLPFRAPTLFNQHLRQLAARNADRVLLCDIEESFKAAAAHGIAGNELVCEYVHPTPYGHYLMARTMALRLAQSELATAWELGGEGALRSYEAYAAELGYTLADLVSHRNDLILFLRMMPYEEPPAILRQYVSELVRTQVRDILRLPPGERQHFVQRGGVTFLLRMADFVPPAERQAIENLLLPLENRS